MFNTKHPNDLKVYRLRMRFSRKYVAKLLGHGSTVALTRLEMGRALPTLNTALTLATIYRVPVDFLYSKRYFALRERIRSLESKYQSPRHQQKILNIQR